MAVKSNAKQSGDYEPLPKEFMADVAKSVDSPGDGDGDEVDVDMKEATEQAVKGFADYGDDDDDDDDDGDVDKGGPGSGPHPGGGGYGGEEEERGPRKYPNLRGATVEEGGNRISDETQEANEARSYPNLRRGIAATQAAIATLKKHAPAGAGQGVGQLFGGTPGGGFMQGMGYGQGVGAEAASGQIEAPHTLAHFATSKLGQMMQPPMHTMGHGAASPAAAPGAAPAPAPVAPQPMQQAAAPMMPHPAAAPAAPAPQPAAAPAPHTQSPGGGMGGGAHGVGAPMMRSVGMCAACKAGTCKEHHDDVDKALTSRALAIPVHLRRSAYDTFQSATTQTSRMYSSIAPDVSDTINQVMDGEDVRTRRAAEDLKRSQAVQQMRVEMQQWLKPRRDVKFGG
jgi:hypothetical protein